MHPRFTITTRISDPTPFGSGMKTRGYSAQKYRFGFNGKEEDGETVADAHDYGARIYDARLGRWLAVDKLFKQYTSITPFNFGFNSPLVFIDIDGNEIVPSPAFQKTVFNNVYKYLIENNANYKTMLGKYTDAENKKFIYKLGVDQNAIPADFGGWTSSKYTTREELIGDRKRTVTETANAQSDFRTEKGHSESPTLWTLYIMVHEGIHAAEALNPKVASKKADHNAYAELQHKAKDIFEEMNRELGLGLSSEEVTVLSWCGAEDSEKFDAYIKDRAEKSGRKYNDEKAEYERQVNVLLSESWKINLKSSNNERPQELKEKNISPGEN